MTPAEAQAIDTRLAALWGEEQAARTRIEQDLRALQHAVGEKRHGTYAYRDPRQFLSTPEQAEAIAREQDAAGTLSVRHRSAVQYSLQDLGVQREVLRILRDEAAPLEAQYRADPWPRFFLVVASDGHIHSSRECSTTFPTTQWAWLPSLSGLDEDAAVREQGPRLCSVCFPSAPVEWTLGLPKAPRCPGSGQIVDRLSRFSRYGKCPSCGKAFALSTTGAIRAHKPQKES